MHASSHVALLLGAILEEGVHQLGVNEVPGVQAVEHPVAAVMGDAAEDGETGDQDGVTVVAERPVLDQSDERVQAPESDELVTHPGVRAEPGINIVINIINIIIDEQWDYNTRGPAEILSVMTAAMTIRMKLRYQLIICSDAISKLIDQKKLLCSYR